MKLLPNPRCLPAPLLGLLLAAGGCSSPAPSFQTADIYARKQEKTLGADFEFPAHQRADVRDVLFALYGSPDEPHLPQVEGASFEGVLKPQNLAAAAGAVGSDEQGRARGLYRQHCVHCHGVTGDGRGPTAAFLNPYPRDFRMGVFKFKSTPKGERPTDDDLRRTLEEGIPGTAMPSFRLLAHDELEALIDYVKYLSIRGETERKLLEALTELEEDDRLLQSPGDPGADAETIADQKALVADVVGGVAQRWARANSKATLIEPRPAGWDDPERLAASVARGRDLFYGDVANCVKCHGDSAQGDGQTTDFDDWTKELEPTDPAALAEFLALGALPPRNIQPRNLRQGVYRGGRRPIDLYWRIFNGIDGSPMPASSALLKAADADPAIKGLTQEDLWALVDYVRSLPYEPASQPTQHRASLGRERL